MFEPLTSPRSAALSADELAVLLGRLAATDGAEVAESGLIDLLAGLERVKAGAAAAQARVTATLVAERSRAEAELGVPVSERCRGLGAEVALARRDSPARGGRHVGMAMALVHEMPEALAALTRGDVPEWGATVVVRETAVLQREHRTQVDTELAGRFATLGVRALAAAARTIGYRLDPGSAIRRTRGATADRHVSLRPAPDTMSCLTGFLPVAQGVACRVALERAADSRRAQGDPRTRGQLMADTLVERITGQSRADAVDLEVQLVMTDRSLLAGDAEPAHLDGYGPIPAAAARQLVRDADRVWVRRLFLSPDATSLVAMESRRRCFAGGLRAFVVVRDQTCRTPWCDAPVRQLDHVTRASDGGETTAVNGEGLCEACNQAKEAARWHARTLTGAPGAPHIVEITTPTGHRYRSRAPAPPGARIDLATPAEAALRLVLAA